MTSNYDNTGDDELIGAIRSGSRDAGRAIVTRYLSDVYAVALRISGNSADAEDIAQDTFIRAFERLNQYNSQHSFRNWLLKIATNLAISHLRDRRREAEMKRRIGRAGWKESCAAECDRDAEDCRSWLEHVEESQRAAIVLFHFQEMSYAQVAQAMAVPVNTVRTLIHRGRKRLRELMSGRSEQAERTHEVL